MHPTSPGPRAYNSPWLTPAGIYASLIAVFAGLENEWPRVSQEKGQKLIVTATRECPGDPTSYSFSNNGFTTAMRLDGELVI